MLIGMMLLKDVEGYILISQGYNWIGLGAVGELFEPGAKPSLFTQSALLGSFRCATIRFFSSNLFGRV